MPHDFRLPATDRPPIDFQEFASRRDGLKAALNGAQAQK